MKRLLAMAAVTFVAAATRADDTALGRAIYEEGMRLYKDGRFDEACPKFRAAYDAHASVLVLGRLALCYERAGKTASAVATYRQVATDARDDPKLADARTAALAARDRLLPLVPQLTIAVAVPVEGLVVKRDNEQLAPAAFGVPLPVDPGAHVVRASAAGYVNFEKQVKLEAGGKDRVEVTLEKVPPPPPPEPTPAPPEPAPVAVVPPPVVETPPAPQPADVPAAAHPGAKLRMAGLVTGGVGVAGLAAGVFFGLRTRSLSNQLSERYSNSVLDDARAANRNTIICYTVGGAAVVSAGILYYLGVRADRAAPDSVAVTSRGIALTWAF